MACPGRATLHTPGTGVRRAAPAEGDHKMTLTRQPRHPDRNGELVSLELLPRRSAGRTSPSAVHFLEEPSRKCANSATARPRSLGRRGHNLLVAERHQSAGHRGMGCASAMRRLPLASGPPSGAWFADNKARGGLHPLPSTCRGAVSRCRGNRTGPGKDVAYGAEEIDYCIVPGWYSTPEHG